LPDGVGNGDGLGGQFSRDGRDAFGFQGENVFYQSPGVLLCLPALVPARCPGIKTAKYAVSRLSP
jgi:hypothetical protein